MDAHQTPINQRRSPFAAVSPAIVIGAGVLVLWGWLFNVTTLKSVLPGLTAMNPLSALVFVLAGSALWLLSTPQTLRVGRVFVLGIIAIALLKLADIFLGWGIAEHVFFADQLPASSPPNYMAPNTAVAFFLVGLAMFASIRASFRWLILGQVLILTAGLIAFLAIIGYVYNVSAFYGFSHYIPMALNTALTFVVLCAGILATHPDVGIMSFWRSNTTAGVLARRLLPLSVIVPSILGWLRLLGERTGLYESAVGAALTTTFYVILLIGFDWWLIYYLDRGDRARTRVEAALRESERRYRALFDSSGDAILIFDQHGHYVDANSQTQRLTGHCREEILSKSVGDFAVYKEAGQAALHEVLQTGQVLTDYQLKRKDGSEVAVELSARKVTDQLYQMIIHDISERKKAEEDLRRSLEQERQLSELKSRFVSTVSHEFRTPLAVIQSSTDLLLHYDEHLNAARRQERLERIQLEVNHMVEMLNDILIIRKAEAVGVEFQPKPLDLREFCVNLVAELQPAMPTHRIIFSSSGECADICIDAKLLRQAITNLLSNAVKYSPGRDHVAFDLACGEREVVLHVQDEGIGIPPEDQPHLFTTFHRGRNVNSISGTGLGLAIVKQAIEAHGGEISLVSELDLGTIFTIQLPRQNPA